MASKRGNDYFEMFLELNDYTCRASKALEDILAHFSVDTAEQSRIALHEIEHAADLHLHTVKEKLAKEFITPIEREDIMLLTSQIDDITDAIEDVIVKLYMYHINEVRPEAIQFCAIISRCCEGLNTVFKEFKGFKKSKSLQPAIIEVNRLEEEGDELFRESMRHLYDGSNDPITVIAWSDIFSKLEKCCDLCEDAADSVDEIVMKNS